MKYNDISQDKDPQLWRMARRRVAFRRHLFSYLSVNTFLWLIWFFTEAHHSHAGIPWPLWSTLGWGIGVASSWFGAFGPGSSSADPAEAEYERLLRERQSR